MAPGRLVSSDLACVEKDLLEPQNSWDGRARRRASRAEVLLARFEVSSARWRLLRSPQRFTYLQRPTLTRPYSPQDEATLARGC